LLPFKLDADVQDVVTYLRLWKNKSEFVRFALLHERDRWIDEARQAKKRFEKENHSPGGKVDFSSAYGSRRERGDEKNKQSLDCED